MEDWAPAHLAYDWDHVGLQVGSYKQEVSKILVTLDVVEPVVDEAIEKGIDLIIAHHPLLFKAIHTLDMDSQKGRIIQKLIQHGISVFAAHTNLDIAAGGVNDMLADCLNLQHRKPLVVTYQEPLYKLAVYVPETHIEQILDAFAVHGAGHIGNYSHCSFQTKGIGTFKPLEDTIPFIGTPHQLEEVAEKKVETIVPQRLLHDTLAAVIAAHPYEEPAYDIYPLQNKTNNLGLGRIGMLPKEMTTAELCSVVKSAYQVDNLRIAGNLESSATCVAILGGSGEKYIDAAIRAGADAFITGDLSFHPALDGKLDGITLIDPGHHVEKVMINGTVSYLKAQLHQTEIEVLGSNVDTEPFTFI